MALRRVSVNVPATSANLGPGFDCMGMALNLYNTITLERSDRFAIEIEGQGAEGLSQGEDNLLYQAVYAVYQRAGRPMPTLRLRCRNEFPPNRGLGGSAAAIVGGLLAAQALEELSFPQRELLDLAASLEGHPDNVTPALLGGFQIVVSDGVELITSSVPVRRKIRAVLFIPDLEMPTQRARALLSQEVSRFDAVYNIGRAAMLVLALSHGQWELLRIATQDRLHQAARESMFPIMGGLFDAAREAGAAGVFLSGAGPTILALTNRNTRAIGSALVAAARREGVTGSWRTVTLAARGAHVVEAE